MQNAPLEGRLGCARFEFDFALHGGAVGDITVGPKLLPKGAIVESGIIHVKTAFTSGGSATVAVKALSANDILAATAIASLTLNALVDVVPDGAATNMFRCTAATQLTVTIAVEALTAGKMAICLNYCDSGD